MAQGSSLLGDVDWPSPQPRWAPMPTGAKGMSRNLSSQVLQSRGEQVKMQMPRPTGELLV